MCQPSPCSPGVVPDALFNKRCKSGSSHWLKAKSQPFEAAPLEPKIIFTSYFFSSGASITFSQILSQMSGESENVIGSNIESWNHSVLKDL